MRHPVLSTISVFLPVATGLAAAILEGCHIRLGALKFGFMLVPVAGFMVAVGSFTRGEGPRWLALVGFVLNLFWACIAPLFSMAPVIM